MFFNQWEAKPKPIAPCMRHFSRALNELQLIARNCDWFIALPAPVVIGRSNCFGFGFSTVIWKPLYYHDLASSSPWWNVTHYQYFSLASFGKFQLLSKPHKLIFCNLVHKGVSVLVVVPVQGIQHQYNHLFVCLGQMKTESFLMTGDS